MISSSWFCATFLVVCCASLEEASTGLRFLEEASTDLRFPAQVKSKRFLLEKNTRKWIPWFVALRGGVILNNDPKSREEARRIKREKNERRSCRSHTLIYAMCRFRSCSSLKVTADSAPYLRAYPYPSAYRWHKPSRHRSGR